MVIQSAGRKPYLSPWLHHKKWNPNLNILVLIFFYWHGKRWRLGWQASHAVQCLSWIMTQCSTSVRKIKLKKQLKSGLSCRNLASMQTDEKLLCQGDDKVLQEILLYWFCCFFLWKNSDVLHPLVQSLAPHW